MMSPRPTTSAIHSGMPVNGSFVVVTVLVSGFAVCVAALTPAAPAGAVLGLAVCDAPWTPAFVLAGVEAAAADVEAAAVGAVDCVAGAAVVGAWVVTAAVGEAVTDVVEVGVIVVPAVAAAQPELMAAADDAFSENVCPLNWNDGTTSFRS